jgi:RNA exonuclease 4
VFVKPPEGATVHSYLTPLTGLTKELIEAHGVPLPEAIQRLRAALPTHAVLVGQNIAKDVQWLNLVEGTDFAGMLDLAGLWRVWNAQYNSWSVFGQDHLVKTLLGAEVAAQHDAASDALKSVRMFNYYNWLQTPQGGARRRSKTPRRVCCRLRPSRASPGRTRASRGAAWGTGRRARAERRSLGDANAYRFYV